MFLNFLPTVIVFQGEKPVFVRERASNMYDIWVYATTKMFAEIPIMLLVPMMLLVLVYPSIGYQDRLSEFFKFYLIMALMVQAATAMGYFLSSVFNSETAAVAFAPIMNLPLSLLGGYMINLTTIKGKWPQQALEWLQYVSPVRYCFNGLMDSQWPLITDKYGSTVK
jgi:ABC-type multidrug transport system permease subunit